MSKIYRMFDQSGLYRRSSAVIALAAVALTAAACSSSSTQTPSQSSVTSQPASTDSSSTGSTSLSGTPIKIGMAVAETGYNSLLAGPSAKAGLAWANGSMPTAG